MKTTATNARHETAEELAMTAEDAAIARFNAAMFPDLKSANSAAEARHTPTPWIQVLLHPTHLIGAPGIQTHVAEFRLKEDADLALAAVNAHAGLVARVQELEAALGDAVKYFSRGVDLAELETTNPEERRVYLEITGELAMMRAALGKEAGK